jgi:hypothetical protein
MASPDEWFNGTLDAFVTGTLPAYSVFDLGLSPRLGINKLPRAQILMRQNILRKAVEKHEMDLVCLRNLPSSISGPIMIFDSNSDNRSVVWVLDIFYGAKRVVAVTEYMKHADFGMIHMVKSVHPRDVEHFARWEKLGLLIYKKEVAKQPLQDSARYNCEQQADESLAMSK